MKHPIRISLFGAFLFAGQALAAPALVNVQGDVLLNQGERFAPAKSGEMLKAGNRVLTAKDSTAGIQFDDACVMTLEPESLVTVPEISPCQQQLLLAQAESESTERGAGIVIGGAESGEAGLSAAAIAGIAVGGIGAAYVIYEEFIDDDDDEPAPPISP